MYLLQLSPRGFSGFRAVTTRIISRPLLCCLRTAKPGSSTYGREFSVTCYNGNTGKPAPKHRQERVLVILPSHCNPESVSIVIDTNNSSVSWNKVQQQQKQPLKKAGATLWKNDDQWREQTFALRDLPKLYSKLAKLKLTGLVVMTAMAGYLLAPGQFVMGTFLLATLGTAMCSASANSINQWLEIPFDCQMARTQDRVLVRKLLSPHHALAFGCVTGAAGVLTLLCLVNAPTAFLGALNIVLYTSVYTPLKRLSIANTWVGSLVGALPPMMGWAACTGDLGIGALLFAGVLYSWQFAHFNALSWNLRADYSRAGYRMMSVTDPALCRRVALRHSLALIGLSTLLPVCDVTTWWLALDSLPANVWLSWLAFRFYKDSDNKSARKLFRFSLIHLPLIMFFILLHKKQKESKNSVESMNDAASLSTA